MKRFLTAAALLLVTLTPFALQAQDGPQWQRRNAATQLAPSIFSSTHSVNLPTTETLSKGELLFEISHRFTRPIDAGADALWGFDGGVNLRLALSYAVTDRVMVGVSRSNLDDNLDLGIKTRIAELDLGIPVQIGAAGSFVWNTEALSAGGSDTNQMHAELIVDLGLTDRIAVGLVPGVITNPWINQNGEDAAYFLGGHARFEMSSSASLIGEWVTSSDRGDLIYDSGSFGIELETGGHFFKVIVGNSIRLNPSQAFAGSEIPFDANQMRFGFNITRILGG